MTCRAASIAQGGLERGWPGRSLGGMGGEPSEIQGGGATALRRLPTVPVGGCGMDEREGGVCGVHAASLGGAGALRRLAPPPAQRAPQQPAAALPLHSWTAAAAAGAAVRAAVRAAVAPAPSGAAVRTALQWWDSCGGRGWLAGGRGAPAQAMLPWQEPADGPS